jgi:hypothetical protein
MMNREAHRCFVLVFLKLHKMTTNFLTRHHLFGFFWVAKDDDEPEAIVISWFFSSIVKDGNDFLCFFLQFQKTTTN